MSLGIPYVAPLPTPGVTPSPAFESQLVAHCQETELKLEAKVVDADIALTAGDVPVHGIRTFELGAAGASFIGFVYDPATLYAASAAGGNTATHTLPVQPGQRIRTVTVHGRNSGVAWTVALLSIDKATGAVTAISSTTSGAVAGTIEARTLAVSTTVLANVAYVVRMTAGAAADRFLGASFGVDRP
jgi:hypothetical protein